MSPELHVTFLAEKPDAALVRAVDAFDAGADEFGVVGREVYLHCPNGYGNTKINNGVLREAAAGGRDDAQLEHGHEVARPRVAVNATRPHPKVRPRPLVRFAAYLNVVAPPLSVAFVPGFFVHAPAGAVSVMVPVEVVPANWPFVIFVTSLIFAGSHALAS